MKLSFSAVSAPDLLRRGLTLHAAGSAELLLDIEADLVISDGDRTLYSERHFPVAELARALSLWLRTPAERRGAFEFDSMAFDVLGAVRIRASDDGWCVGSVFEEEAWSTPLPWKALVSELEDYVERVRDGVAAIGINPDVTLRA